MRFNSIAAVGLGVLAQIAALTVFAAGDAGVGGATASARVATAAPAAQVSAAAPVAVATSHPFAAPQAVSAATAPSAGGVAQVTFALLIVLVAIFAVAWIARRMRGFGNRVGGAIDVLAEVQLGQKERAVLLRVGSKQILLGVAPGRVNTLHVLEEPLELTQPSSGANDSRPNFKQLMLRSLGK